MFVGGEVEFSSKKSPVVKSKARISAKYYLKIVDKLSTGSTKTSRNRFKEDRFLAMKIEMPKYDEAVESMVRIRRAKLGIRGQMREADGRRVLRIQIAIAQVLFVERLSLANHVWEKAEEIAQVRQAVDPRGEQKSAGLQDAGRFGHRLAPRLQGAKVIQRSQHQYSIERACRQTIETRRGLPADPGDGFAQTGGAQACRDGVQQACRYIYQVQPAALRARNSE